MRNLMYALPVLALTAFAPNASKAADLGGDCCEGRPAVVEGPPVYRDYDAYDEGPVYYRRPYYGPAFYGPRYYRPFPYYAGYYPYRWGPGPGWYGRRGGWGGGWRGGYGHRFGGGHRGWR